MSVDHRRFDAFQILVDLETTAVLVHEICISLLHNNVVGATPQHRPTPQHSSFYTATFPFRAAGERIVAIASFFSAKAVVHVEIFTAISRDDELPSNKFSVMNKV